MKERKNRSSRSSLPWRSCLFYIIILLLALSTLRLFFPGTIYDLLFSCNLVDGSSVSPAVFVEESIIFPEQTLFFLKYVQPIPYYSRDDIECVYTSFNTSTMKLPVISVYDDYLGTQIVRCQLPPGGMIISLASKSIGKYLPGGPMLTWDSLAFDALLDVDNTTIVFVKGLNLRGGKFSDPSKYKCVYGKSLDKSNFLLQSDVISIGQEIVRCKTPSIVLRNPPGFKVSVRVVGWRTLDTVARPVRRFQHDESSDPNVHEMCVCTMLRNQARFLKEWVMYHAHIGVQQWFIYDNNSDDNLENVIKSLEEANYNVTRHVWPWIKSQEAGFSHCAMRARGTCRWVGFIDVDEFVHLPSSSTLVDVIRNNKYVNSKIGEIRVPCRSFGPSGLKRSPVEGVTIGYTCRLHGFERHKSIIRPEALNFTLINVVHHFHLKSGYKSMNMHSWLMVINHYKYQVWEVFKNKFESRVATYVSDWQHDKNVASKDRAPGLGTTAVEPSDWSRRFCDIHDRSLRDRVLKIFSDPKLSFGFLPWKQ